MRTSQRLTATLLAISAAALLGACGDDSGGTADARPDGPPGTPDASPTPDAAPPTPTRAGTIAVTEVGLLSSVDAVARQGLYGAALSVSFENLTGARGTVKIDTGTPGCSVTTYTCTGTLASCGFPTPVDAGPVKISNVNAGTPAIVGAVPPECKFFAAAGDTPAGYRCPVADPITNQAGGVSSPRANTLAFAFAAQTFNANLRGTWVVMTGLPGALAAFNGKALPVVSAAAPAPGVIVVAVPVVPPLPDPPTFTGVGAQFFQGLGPVPGGADPKNLLNFLTDGNPATEQLKIEFDGTAENLLPDVNLTLTPGGEGFKLDTTCTNCKSPLTFPTTIAENAPPDDPAAVFSCKTGECGAAAVGTGILNAWAVSGTASDGLLTDVQPFEMPKTNVTKFASFSCSSLEPSLTIPNKVLKEILSVSPTRIETRVFRVGAPFPIVNAATGNTIRVITAHGFVGHAPAPPAAQ